ncbi:MAG: hypothetical protein WAY02_12905 [Burkholderiaceae bacterium]
MATRSSGKSCQLTAYRDRVEPGFQSIGNGVTQRSNLPDAGISLSQLSFKPHQRTTPRDNTLI